MNVLYYFFYLFCFFPFVRLLPLDFDSQPYALLLAFIITVLNLHRRVNKYIYYLLLLNVISILLIPFAVKYDIDLVRSLLNYQSLFFISNAVCIAYRKVGIPKFAFFKFVCMGYFVVGLLQITIVPDAFMFLLSRSNSAVIETGRGVCGLTPEPSYYGSICLLLLIFNYMIYRTEKGFKLIHCLLILQLLLFSRSSMSIFVIFLSYFVYTSFTFLSKWRNLLYLSLIISLFIVSFNSISILLDGTRFGKLLSTFINNPLLFVVADQSVNERFVNLFFPFYSLIDNYLIPHSYNSFGDYIYTMATSPDFGSFFLEHREYRRILSGLGTAFYELGVFSFILVSVIIAAFKYANNYTYRLLYCLIFVFLLLNAISLSNALIVFIVGSLIYKASINKSVSLANCKSSN